MDGVLKIDFKKNLKHLYEASAQTPSLVEVPDLGFLMLDGAGDPNDSPRFQDAVQALFAVSYAIKFIVKKEKGADYGVMPLEGLWHADDLSQFSPDRKDLWQWTVMIMQPDFVSSRLVWQALEQVRIKQKSPLLTEMKFLRYREGLAAQLLYTGPYAEEWPAVARLHGFIQDKGYNLRGRHHEIYLSDPRRTPPETLKTIIRQPVA